MTLDQLEIGRSATITDVGGEGALRQHFLSMGVIPGAEVTLIKFAPMGDPMELRIHGYELTLRIDDAKQIGIADVHDACKPQANRPHVRREHPGLGETGRYHVKAEEHPLPPGTKLTFALAGNQNSGKTTLFNQLTGANQHVGNFPGVTVDRKDGDIRGQENASVTDLPGIYSLSPYTSEEMVTRRFILSEKPHGIIDIVDATNIERNLYLTLQLLELDIPMVIALNMMDEMRENGGSVLVNELEARLGVPVVPISASKGEGIAELLHHAVHVAQYQERPSHVDLCSETSQYEAVDRCLRGVTHHIEDKAIAAGLPVRFAASKLVEGDEHVRDQLALSEDEAEMVERLIANMEKEQGIDRAAAVAGMRYAFIERVCADTVVKPGESSERTRSEKIDRILTGKYTAIPAFVIIMGIVFYLTFGIIGGTLSDWIKVGIDALSRMVDTGLTHFGVNPVMRSLVVDGVFGGVGSVLSFLPYIVTLFFFLSLLEDSGYMARVAFVMDKLLRRIGLSGRSIVPMLVGFGCTVPGVMATRTLPSERDRRMTILLTPFMSCSAKLPIYAFISALFFPNHVALVMIGLYALGVLMGVLTAVLFKRFAFQGEPVPFVMELPNYRMPSARNVLQLLWEKAKDFLQRAFTVIFVATIVIWFLQTFDIRFNVVENSQNSMLAMLAGFAAPLLAPLGFGDWRICTALVSGFLAKEGVVSSLMLLFGSESAILAALTPLSAASLLVFCLLYTPCVAAISCVKRELGTKWALLVVVFQCVVAWLAAFAVRMIGLMIGGIF